MLNLQKTLASKLTQLLLASPSAPLAESSKTSLLTGLPRYISSTPTALRKSSDNLGACWRKLSMTCELNLHTDSCPRYYLLYSNANEEIVEFPKGFELIAGNAFRRNFTAKIPEPPKSDWAGYEISQEALMEKSIGFNCLHYDTDAKGITQPEASLGRHFMPDKPYIDEHCTSGVRLELFFPSCWNGKDAASEDHKSHMVCFILISA